MDINRVLPGIGESCDGLFTVEYSGLNPVLSSHRIDVREYVVSLGGYDGFVRHVAKEILRANVTISVASEKRGSFESSLHVILETIGAVSSVFGILAFFGVSAKNMGEALAGVQAAVINRYIAYSGDVKRLLADVFDYSELSDEDKEKLKKLFDDEFFLESLDSFTMPLDTKGYDQIKVSGGGRELFKVAKSDRSYFMFVSPADEKVEYFEDTVEVLYLSPELIRWRFKGKETFWADVLDAAFLDNTGNMKYTELKGAKYFARGRKVAIRKKAQRSGSRHGI